MRIDDKVFYHGNSFLLRIQITGLQVFRVVVVLVDVAVVGIFPGDNVEKSASPRFKF